MQTVFLCIVWPCYPFRLSFCALHGHAIILRFRVIQCAFQDKDCRTISLGNHYVTCSVIDVKRQKLYIATNESPAWIIKVAPKTVFFDHTVRSCFKEPSAMLLTCFYHVSTMSLKCLHQ